MSTLDARMVVRNMRQFKAELESADNDRKKAGQTAVKVEGYRLMKVLKKELRAGSPGGKHLKPLRVVSGRKRNPLSRMAKAVRYKAIGQYDNLKVMVGFLFIASSRRWVSLAKMQQEGFTTSADESTWSHGSSPRQKFIRTGAGLGKRSKRSKYYFLRKSTKQLKTPARPIIEPFWQAHESNAVKNIISNFNRKMAGERI